MYHICTPNSLHFEQDLIELFRRQKAPSFASSRWLPQSTRRQDDEKVQRKKTCYPLHTLQSFELSQVAESTAFSQEFSFFLETSAVRGTYSGTRSHHDTDRN